MRDCLGSQDLVSKGGGRREVGGETNCVIMAGSRPSSPGGVNINLSGTREKKKTPVFIPRARSRSRNVSGSPLRSLEAKLEPR